MAREIKFRAWLNGQDRYVGVDDIDFDEGMFCVSHLALAQLGSIEILGNIYENPELI